jgi:hypothetical protein
VRGEHAREIHPIGASWITRQWVSGESYQREQGHWQRATAHQQQGDHRFKDGGQHLAAKRYLSGSAVPSIQNQVRGSRCHQGHGGQAGPVVTENLLCVPTLSAGETDQGNRAAAMQRRSGSQSGECREKSGSVHKTNGSYRRRGPTDTKRRGVGIGDEVLRPEESLRCARVLASPRLSIPEHLWPAPDEFGSPDSRQNNFAESGATIFHSTR